MEFQVDILEDVAAEVENVMRLGAIGNFKKARRASVAIEGHLDLFPVLADFLRLLCQQGDIVELCKVAGEALGADSGDLWTESQTILPTLLELLGTVHEARYSASAFEHVQRDIGSALELIGAGSDYEEQVFATVIMLELRFLKHDSSIDSLDADSSFLPDWRPDEPQFALCRFIERVISEDNYWAAETALKVSFRYQKRLGSGYFEIWDAIHAFAGTTKPSDRDDELWAKIALLQSFCEGLSRSDASAMRLE